MARLLISPEVIHFSFPQVQSTAVEFPSSPPSSNGTLSPVVISPQHQTRPHPNHTPNISHPYASDNHYTPAPAPSVVQVLPQRETDDSASLRRLGNPVVPSAPYAYTSTNFKHYNSAPPPFLYPNTGMLMNQHVIQPMWQ